MVGKGESQFAAQILDGLGRMVGVCQQGLTVSDDFPERRSTSLLFPLGQQRVDPGKLLRLLVVEAVIVIVVFGTGNEPFQYGRAVLCQRVGFSEPDFLGGGNRPGRCSPQQQECPNRRPYVSPRHGRLPFLPAEPENPHPLPQCT